MDELLLCGETALGEVVLEVLDAAESHDTFSLRCTATKWLLGLVRGINVGISRGRTLRFLGRR